MQPIPKTQLPVPNRPSTVRPLLGLLKASQRCVWTLEAVEPQHGMSRASLASTSHLCPAVGLPGHQHGFRIQKPRGLNT